MNLSLNTLLIKEYKNNSQIARILTEDWLEKNGYCPNCGHNYLSRFTNNKPVADFFCYGCKEEFELKSKSGDIGDKILDGAYSKMIERINAYNNPNFFFLNYNKNNFNINNLIVIPKHLFIDDIIEKRKPLSSEAKRAGWVGCNINISKIPDIGKIFLIKDSSIIPKYVVNEIWKNTLFLKGNSLNKRGWLIDIMLCIDDINNDKFKLNDIYKFEEKLKLKYPLNNFIRDKIRQQLQILRDKGIIKFLGNGVYQKLNFRLYE